MTNNPVTTLFMVRHGQSEWNASGRWQGRANPPLSELGEKQANVAAGRVGSVDLIVSSPQERAFRTATIISTQIGVGPVQVLEEIQERAVGEWSGLTSAEIEEKWPGWIASTNRPPGWEQDDVLQERVIGALNSLAQSFSGAQILVVCHSGIISNLEQFFGVREGRTTNLAGRVFAHDGSEIAPGDRLDLLSDTELSAPAPEAQPL